MPTLARCVPVKSTAFTSKFSTNECQRKPQLGCGVSISVCIIQKHAPAQRRWYELLHPGRCGDQVITVLNVRGVL